MQFDKMGHITFSQRIPIDGDRLGVDLMRNKLGDYIVVQNGNISIIRVNSEGLNPIFAPVDSLRYLTENIAFIQSNSIVNAVQIAESGTWNSVFKISKPNDTLVFSQIKYYPKTDMLKVQYSGGVVQYPFLLKSNLERTELYNVRVGGEHLNPFFTAENDNFLSLIISFII